MSAQRCGECGDVRRIKARGLCVKCYSRLLRSGSVPPLDPMDRVWRKVDKLGPQGCWLWTAYINAGGYGRVRWGETNLNAHRLIYRVLVGPIPEGLHLDHLCRVRHCVNPAHLEPVTPHENVLRAEPANRTHCPSGHAYDEANTRVRNGRRHCLACHRTHQANYLARKRVS